MRLASGRWCYSTHSPSFKLYSLGVIHRTGGLLARGRSVPGSDLNPCIFFLSAYLKAEDCRWRPRTLEDLETAVGRSRSDSTCHTREGRVMKAQYVYFPPRLSFGNTKKLHAITFLENKFLFTVSYSLLLLAF